ncbi:MAG TPA: CDP-alcohol phosphatidyltransferase family protein [Candidatus Binataceae bacterium]|nr:CDP-alcohol phosphatidyltransferase family protein [Candidatus Binataceae bacterium]
MASTPVVGSRALHRRTAGVRTTANLLSASRIALGAMWLCAFIRGERQCIVLGAIALCAASTDLADGPLARRAGSASALGRWLDSFADVAFVLTVLICEAAVGAIPVYVPILIGISFTQYVLDSILIRGADAPVRSRLGHWGGVVNYFLVILLAFAPAFTPFAWLVRACAPALAVFFAGAIIERVCGYGAIRLRARRPSPVRDSRAEDTPIRSVRCRT